MKCPGCTAEFMSTQANRNLAGTATCPQCGQPLTIGEAELAEDVEMRARLAAADAAISGAGRSLVSEAVAIGDGAFALDVKEPEPEPEVRLAAPGTSISRDDMPAMSAPSGPPPRTSSSASLKLPSSDRVPALSGSGRIGVAEGPASEEELAASLSTDGLPSLKAVARPTTGSHGRASQELRAAGGRASREMAAVLDDEEDAAPVASTSGRFARLKTGDAGVSLSFMDGDGVRIGIAVVVAGLIGAVILHSVISAGGESIPDEALEGYFHAPEAAEARLAAGEKKAAEGDHLGALAQLESALQADPDLAAAYKAMADSYEALGMYDEAIEALTRYRNAAPEGEDPDALSERLKRLAE